MGGGGGGGGPPIPGGGGGGGGPPPPNMGGGGGGGPPGNGEAVTGRMRMLTSSSSPRSVKSRSLMRRGRRMVCISWSQWSSFTPLADLRRSWPWRRNIV